MNSHLRSFWSLAIFVLLAAPALAQEKATPDKAAQGKPSAAEKTAELLKNIEKRFGEKVEVRFDQPYAGTSNKFQMVDLYLPKQRASDKPLPVVVFIHGGGWTGGDRKGYAVPAATLAASGNYVAASVGYRLSGEAHWPQQIFDCKAAIRWLRGHAKELGIDPDKIGVTGASAGGHLVTLLGLTGGAKIGATGGLDISVTSVTITTTGPAGDGQEAPPSGITTGIKIGGIGRPSGGKPATLIAGVKELEGDIGEYTSESSRVTCVVNVCGPMDLTKPLMQGEAAKTDDPAVSALLGGPVHEKLALAKQASPLTYVTAQAVPIMTIHGTADQRVNFTNAEELDAALKKVGATSLLIPVVGAGHGIPFGPELQGRVQAFWDMYLRGEKSDISTAPIEAGSSAKK